MQLHPTRSTFHVAVAGAGLIALGAAARLAPVVAFGGAMLLTVAIGRAIAVVAVTRLRSAGFEMLWSGSTRAHRIARGGTLVVQGELHNHGDDAVRGIALRPIASGMLTAELSPEVLDLPGRSRARVDLTVTGHRVGRWGVHGLALEVRGTPFGGEGLYEIPLLFANPLGIEVLPSSVAFYVTSAYGGRARRAAELGKPANLPGEGDEMRELRDHAPGDSFKRIAWKASARRGRLLVRSMEREERDIVWLVLDASVELWAGVPGHAPLDRMVDDLASLATRHLTRGDRVGLAVAASRLRAWISPDRGPTHATMLARALASAASCIDVDRSAIDEKEVGRRVADHARPLDPLSLADLPPGSLDALAARAEQLRSRAPFSPRLPFASTNRERSLRHYMAAFGIESPPILDGERPKTEAMLAQVFQKLTTEKPRATIVHVWAPAPSHAETSARAIALLRRRRVIVRWSLPDFDAGVGSEHERRGPLADVVDDAVRLRAKATRTRGERMLRRLGVELVYRAPRAVRHESPEATEATQ